VRGHRRGHHTGCRSTSHPCACEVGRLRGFLEPCAVLLLAAKPVHGYDLLPRLAQFGLEAEAIDAGTLYRTLRRLEQDGILKSEWSTEGSGPAKRIYTVTAEGYEFLRSWYASVEAIRGNLDVFLRECRETLDREESER
jgi:PadR family transcriptional regulator, regulatory protein PadR